MLTRGSRYRKATNYSATAERGGAKQVLDFRLFLSEPSPRSGHSRIDTNRFDLWAHNAYKDPKKYWVIADRLEELFVLDAQIGDTTEVPPVSSANFGNY
tara:strand:+ start:434 stop:730 length:297 start_codon:yes stop_codon:yes gene_type:complete